MAKQPPMAMTVTAVQQRQMQLSVIDSAEKAQDAGYFLRALRETIRKIDADYKARRKKHTTKLAELKDEHDRRRIPFASADELIDTALTTWRLMDRARVAETREAQLAEARAVGAAQRATEIEAAKTAALTASGAEKSMFKALGRALAVAPILPTITTPLAEETKFDGLGLREYWAAEVVDFMALVTAVAAGRAPLAALQANQTWLNGEADSYGDQLSIPGVRAVSTFGQIAKKL